MPDPFSQSREEPASAQPAASTAPNALTPDPLNNQQPGQPPPAQPLAPPTNPTYQVPQQPTMTASPANPQSVVSNADYLDQIATRPKARSPLLTGKMPFALGGLVVAIILFIIMAAAGGGGGAGQSTGILSVRLGNLQTILDYGEANNINSTTRKTMTETRLVLASHKFELSQIYAGDSNFVQPSESVIATESNEGVIASLDQAKATGNLNSAFVNALNSEIESVKQILNTLSAKTRDDNARQSIDSAYSDLTTLAGRLTGN